MKSPKEKLKKGCSPPPPHSYRNSRNYLLVIFFAFLVCGLFPACPVYDQPYFEFPLKTPVPTNIQIEGEYVPKEGEKLPILLYYLDDTFDYGYLDDTGTVVLENKNIVNQEGKFFYRLYLRDVEKSILLGRRFDDNPIRFKLDAQGKLLFRDTLANPNDDNKQYTLIDTMEEFLLMNGDPTLWGGNYLVTNELDMLGGAAMRAPRLNWAPIGMHTHWSTPAAKFTGRFDGGGKKLWNLWIDRTTGACYNIGLFGYVAGAKLKNIVIGSGSVQGYESVGGIVGFAEGNSEISEISGCSNTGEVRADYYAGGVVGYNSMGSITACYNTGNVTANNSNAGGVAGSNNYYSAITACYNTGAVTAGRYAGGVAADNFSSAITACYNTGAVRSPGSYTGGVVGWCYLGSITACYWLNLPGGNAAATGTGTPANDDNTAPFNGAGSWPDFGAGWSAYKWTHPGDETAGKYWKSLGQWSSPPTDGSESVFPKLYWQP
jgi:hypothetical protein